MSWDLEKFEEKLNEDLDNLLSVEEKQELHKQIESNREYRDLSDWYYRIQSIFREIPQENAPEGFTEAIMARVNELPAFEVEDKPAPKFNWKAGLALVAGVVGLAFFVTPTTEDPLANPRPRPVVVAQNEAGNPAEVKAKADLMVASATGVVQVFKKDGFLWKEISEGVDINFEDKIRTLSNSSLFLKYSDGTEVKLKPNSLVQLKPDGMKVYHGDSWVHVIKKGRKFETYTPNLVASVRGTIYDVSVRYNQQPYEEFLKDMTQKTVWKGLSPEVYFRNFSLDTVAEIASTTFEEQVDSGVKVYESSVDVRPLAQDSVTVLDGVIVKEGQGVELKAGAKVLANADIQTLHEKDFQGWGMTVPGHITVNTQVDAKTAGTESSDIQSGSEEATQQGAEENGSSQSSSEESDPSKAFENMNK